MGNCIEKLQEGGAKGQGGNSPSRKKRYESPEAEAAGKNGALKNHGHGMAINAASMVLHKKKKDLSNFQFKDESDKFLFRNPGQINGSQFRIISCKESNLYVHDNHDQCTIDLCTDSVIVMGPCSSSTFIRNCKNCKFIITCQQLRVRDCQNIEIMLYSQTQPVIESSSNIKFVCHQYYYPEMVNQMKSAKISYWNNKWNEIYDFTPNKVVTKGLNYSISLESSSGFATSLEEMKKIVAQVEKTKGEKIGHLKEIGSDDLQKINLNFDDSTDQSQMTTLIPYTCNQAERKATEEFFLFVFLAKPEDLYAPQTIALLQSMQLQFLDNDAYWIQECRSTELTKDQMTQLKENVGVPQKVISMDKVMTIGINLRANARSQHYSDKLGDLALWVITQNKNLRIEPVTKPTQIERAQEYFFRTFNVEHAGHDIAAGGR